MNRLFLLIILTLLTRHTTAQAGPVTFHSWTNGYLQLNSYAGNMQTDAFMLTLAGNGNIHVPNWRVSVRMKQPVTSPATAMQFPIDKISLQPTTTSGQAHPNAIPSVTAIGMPLNVTLQGQQEVFLIPQSNAPLYNEPPSPQGYYELQLRFNLTIAGGAYLGTFPTWTTFHALFELKVYDQYNNIIGIMEHPYQLQIAQLSGQPPASQLSIQVAAPAQKGLLVLSSMADYAQGASVTYPNALLVHTNTDYQLKVKSLQPDFVSANGHVLPLSTVKVSLVPVGGIAATTIPVWLSAVAQKVASGSSTGNVQAYFDIHYATQPNDATLFSAEMEEYTTTLQYEITPQ